MKSSQSLSDQPVYSSRDFSGVPFSWSTLGHLDITQASASPRSYSRTNLKGSIRERTPFTPLPTKGQAREERP